MTSTPFAHVLVWEDPASDHDHILCVIENQPGWQELARYEALRHYLELHSLETAKAYWIDEDNLQVAQPLTRAGADPVEDYPVEHAPLIGWDVR